MKYLVGGQNTEHDNVQSWWEYRRKIAGGGKEKVFLAAAVLLVAPNHKSLCHVSADKRSQAWEEIGDVSGGNGNSLTAACAQQGCGGYTVADVDGDVCFFSPSNSCVSAWTCFCACLLFNRHYSRMPMRICVWLRTVSVSAVSLELLQPLQQCVTVAAVRGSSAPSSCFSSIEGLKARGWACVCVYMCVCFFPPFLLTGGCWGAVGRRDGAAGRQWSNLH